MNDVTITKKDVRQFLLGVVLSLALLSFTFQAIATFYSGSADINLQNSKVVSLGTPSSDTDASTKDYMDGRKKPTYHGLTTSTSQGNLGGLDGANSLCNSKYAGSHLCTQAEMIASGNTSITAGTGWIACNAYNANAAGGIEGLCAGSIHAVQINGGVYDSLCLTYTSITGTNLGASSNGEGFFSATACNNALALHCCS